MTTVKREPSEFDTFTALVDRVLSIPKAEILRREAEYKKRADQNPHKRGPKAKVNPSSSVHAEES